MSSADPNVAEQQRRYREFLDLMPLTIALAGLPTSDTGKYYTEEQMETRAFTLRPHSRVAPARGPQRLICSRANCRAIL